MLHPRLYSIQKYKISDLLFLLGVITSELGTQFYGGKERKGSKVTEAVAWGLFCPAQHFASRRFPGCAKICTMLMVLISNDF